MSSSEALPLAKILLFDLNEPKAVSKEVGVPSSRHHRISARPAGRPLQPHPRPSPTTRRWRIRGCRWCWAT